MSTIRQTVDLAQVLSETESHLILDALKSAEGHQEKAAELLTISVRNLRQRLDRLGLRVTAKDMRCKQPCCRRVNEKSSNL